MFSFYLISQQIKIKRQLLKTLALYSIDYSLVHFVLSAMPY